MSEYKVKKSRLVLAILATSLEEVALAIFILVGLPRLGVELPLGALIGMMAGLATYSVISYRLGIRALLKKPLPGFTDMDGSKGRVVEQLNPAGTVRIGSELWDAKCEDHQIEVGEEIIVVKRDGLKLIVRRNCSETE